MRLNAEDYLHLRIHVNLGRDKRDASGSSEKLHEGTILLSAISKASIFFSAFSSWDKNM